MSVMNSEHAEGRVARAIEQQTAKLPSDTFLWLAGGAIAGALTLKVMGRDKDALFVGPDVPDLRALQQVGQNSRLGLSIGASVLSTLREGERTDACVRPFCCLLMAQ